MRKQDKPALAFRIDLAINGSGLDNDQIAERLGRKSGSGIGHWRSGRGEPSVSQLTQLARLVDRSLYWLVTGKEEPMSIEAMLGKFREEVAAGGDPSEVWERLAGKPMLPGERAILTGRADELREYLRGPEGADWAALDQDEREAVSRLVQLLVRSRSTAPSTSEGNG